MERQFQFMPEQASTMARPVDSLYFFLIAVTAFFTLLIFVMILYLGLKYRRRKGVVPQKVHLSYTLEVAWTVIPLVIVLVMFAWGAALYVRIETPPPGAMEINVVGKQWMWKIQHPQGRREINELHVPTGRPIKLIMTSQDAIHSFFIPAFRTKQDVLPGRYTMEWFTPTKVGKYRLFCTQYCGLDHAVMGGWVYVMEADEYARWLAEEPSPGALAVQGALAFR